MIMNKLYNNLFFRYTESVLSRFSVKIYLSLPVLSNLTNVLLSYMNISLKRFYFIEKEVIQGNFLFITYVSSLFFSAAFIINVPVLGIQEIVPVLVMMPCFFIPKLRNVL